MEEQQQKDYVGVWIPAEISERTDLSPREKWLWAEIAGYKECWASNARLAERMQVSENWISVHLSRLIELGLIERCGFNGRFRKIRVQTLSKNKGRVCEKTKADFVKKQRQTLSKNKPENKVKNKVENNSFTKVKLLANSDVKEVDEKVEYGNPEVNAFIKAFNEVLELPNRATKMDRYAASNFLRRYDHDELRRLLAMVKASTLDKYAPRIATIRDLQSKEQNLRLWAKKRYDERVEVI